MRKPIASAIEKFEVCVEKFALVTPWFTLSNSIKVWAPNPKQIGAERHAASLSERFAVFGGIPKKPKKEARNISAPNVDPTLALLNMDEINQQKAMITNP
mmetsp:Transcript_26649/g.64561  ORF Transcript_26649/g.64561 Transcript_26649/m.64561 type:complete len:100 (-) Transcript_26649:1230-1529(-)